MVLQEGAVPPLVALSQSGTPIVIVILIFSKTPDAVPLESDPNSPTNQIQYVDSFVAMDTLPICGTQWFVA
ncbi:hypothetical protein ACSBR1_039521 [Camellia fascicularis]